MKKISLYVSLAITSLFLGACNEDFDDWASPITNAQDEQITVPGITASDAPAINLADVEGNTVAAFILSQPVLPENITLGNARMEITPDGQDDATPIKLDADVNGFVDVATLQSMVENTFGKRPEERTFNAIVMLNAIKDGQAAFINAGKVVLKVTPKAPVIEEAYYYIGAVNGWTMGDVTYKFSHSGADVYDDPVFTVTVPAPVDDSGNRVDHWFAIAPQSAYDTGDWKKLLGTVAGNGDTSLSGSLAPRTDLADDGSICMPAADGAKLYRISINMMDYTYTITPVAFNEYIYEIGGESGWGTSHALYGADGDGKYQGYYFLNSEFKFKPNPGDDWNGDWEKASGDAYSGALVETGGPNVDAPEAGFYQINVDLAAMTYSLMRISTISVIGNFNSWGGDVDMTYNEAEGCWEADVDNLTNAFKFRVNHDWKYSWGGSNGDPAAYDNLTQNGGKDLDVPNGDGAYHIKLYISCEGNNKVELTKK